MVAKKKTKKQGRPRVGTKPIKLSPGPKLCAHLEALARTELYEKTPAGVALALVREGIRRAVADQIIKIEDDDD